MCRKVWNYALKERKDWIASRKCPVNVCSLRSEYIIPADEPYPSFKIQCQRLTESKKLISELASVNAQALQQVLRRLDRAFERRKKLGAGFPRFKKAVRMRSYVFPQLGKNPMDNFLIVCCRGSHLSAARQWPKRMQGAVVRSVRIVELRSPSPSQTDGINVPVAVLCLVMWPAAWSTP